MTDAEWNDTDGWDQTRKVDGVTFKLSRDEGLWHSKYGAVIGRMDNSNRNWELTDSHGRSWHDSCKDAMQYHIDNLTITEGE